MEQLSDRRTISKKLKHFFSGPIWQGIKAFIDILGLIRSLVILGILGLITGAFVEFGKGILVIIGNGIGTPLGRFSTILFFVLLLGGFLFRHEVRKVKVAIAAGVLLLLSLGGFTASGLIHDNFRMPEDATPKISQLEKQKDALQKELVIAKDTIGQKDNEKGKLTKQVETLQQQNKTYGDAIQQKDREISNIRVQLTDSKNRISLLEKQSQDLQVEVSNLKKISEIPHVRFEYTNKKLFLIDDDKRKELFADYKLYEYSLSKSGKKIAVIGDKGYYYYLIVSNADRDLSNLSVWEVNLPGYDPPKNLKWVSETVLRVNLESKSIIKFDKFLLKGTGTYDITIDEINSLVNVNEFKIGD